jgi:hypothetical protein
MTTKSAANNRPPTLPKSSLDPKRKNTGGDEGSGRKRVSQACNACRGKKLKCNGVRPACSTCVVQERECVYGTLTKKRGLPEGYVRGLERLLALLMAKDGGGSVNSRFQQALVDRTTMGDLIKQWNGEIEDGETLAEVWRGSQLCKAFETLLPELDAPDANGPDLKKPRLSPHAVGLDKSSPKTSQNSEYRFNAKHPPSAILNTSVDADPSFIEIAQSEDVDNRVLNGPKFIQQSADITPAYLKPSSDFAVAAHASIGVQQAALSGQPSVLGDFDSQQMDSMHSTFSVPDDVSRVMDEFALDGTFQTMMSADDSFFEMSNLDYL